MRHGIDACIVWNAHNTVFDSKRSAFFATVELSYNVFFKLNDLHISASLSSVMTYMSRDSIVDRSSPPASALCAVCRQLVPDVAENLGRFLAQSVGNDFELIPAVKMETRHPVEASFGNEFP